jgi:phage terminase large subunit-like protein
MRSTTVATEWIASLPAEECERLYRAWRYRWHAWARLSQLAPEGTWDVWGLCGGRGSGKTRPGAEWTIEQAKKYPGARWALVGRTARDTRDVMVMGESGIMAMSPPWFRPRYYPSRSLVKWPNGFEAHLYSSEEPDLVRGPQHHGGWGDEFAAWKKKEALSNLQDGLRLGQHPQLLLTTTPRRTPLFLDTFLGGRDKATNQRPVQVDSLRGQKDWEFTVTVKDAAGLDVDIRTVVRRFRTEENARNLSPGFAARRRAAYGDSSWGQMELDAEIFDLLEGALFQLEVIEQHRVPAMPPHQRRIVVIDPSHAEDGSYDAAGIVVLGLGPPPPDPKYAKGEQHVYVIEDCTVNGSPNVWGKRAVKAYDDHRADLIVYESNRSPKHPDVVPGVIKSVDPKGRIRWFPVHAASDKRTRADPVASMYEAGRVHHLEIEDKPLHLAQLEHEMVSWDPWDPKAKSPNRVDALVHGVTYLLLQGHHAPTAAPSGTGARVSPWGVR